MIFHDGARLVEIADTVAGTICRYSLPPDNSCEAGGILIGSYRGPHIQIIACTEPLKRDRRARYLFDRRDAGHQRMAMQHWQRSGRTVTFVGEWHTHPERYPSPSALDRRTWQKVSGRNAAGNTVFIIRGYDGWWVGLSTGRVIIELAVIPIRVTASEKLP
jgi:integrative and conjugative element protein (TIGR02256 family)